MMTTAVRRPPSRRDRGMDLVNPLAGNLAQSASVAQRQQSASKAQQIRREQVLRKDVTATGDQFEHQVESCEDLNPVHDDRQGGGRRGKPPHPTNPPPPAEGDDGPPHIDLTA